MKLLLDENFPEGFIKKLKKLGHDVSHINQLGKGKTDKEVFNMAIQQKRIIISNDIDFMPYTKKSDHYGVIRYNSNIYGEDYLLDILENISHDIMKNCYIDTNTKTPYIHTKIYSKKGKYKQTVKKPFNLKK